MSMIEWAKSANYGRFYGELKKISKLNHVPAWLMFADAGISSVLYGSGLQDYLNYRFYEKGPKQRSTYATIGYQYKAYKQIASGQYADRIDHKINFHKIFSAYTRREFFDPSDGLDAMLDFFKRHPVFVKKPIDGLGGGGVEKVEAASIKDPSAYLESLISNKEFLEELVVQDPTWGSLSPGSTNTLRVITGVVDGVSELMFAVARIGSGAAVVDNFHQGGKAVLVDIEAGKLVGNGIAKNLDESPTSPTGITFDGFEIPYWDEVVAMVKKYSDRRAQLGHRG